MDDVDDDRYASQRAVCMAAHRVLLLSPLLGVGCKLGRHCVPVLEIPFSSRQGEEGEEGDDQQQQQLQHRLYTWKGLNSIFVTLMKHDAESTAIYVHPSDMHYHASPLGSLGPGCPVGTTLLAQVVLDKRRQPAQQQQQHDGGWGVSVLIFDAIQIGADDFVQMRMPPVERYSRLRALCSTDAAAAATANNVLTSPAMKLQWAGEYAALRNFCSGPGSHANIDHIPDGYMQYTRKHPCKILISD